MRTFITQLLVLFSGTAFYGQTFTRSELSTTLNTPWEMTYGPDGYLWITEAQGKVVKVDPANGSKTVVHTATDYYTGDSTETCCNCHKPKIGTGTLGLALHPDFMNNATPYVYYVYSYNSGTTALPCTKFKIRRLTLNSTRDVVVASTDLVSNLPTGYDHLGGRMIIVKQNGTPYIFVSIGDNGVSEDNAPSCYNPLSTNPNNTAQDPASKTGKIHRFNIDGTIPADNPIPGNSFYTRGHRNPQGLIFNPDQNLVYDVEHGDRTDDEINVLEAGMNYGWKNVRGYHNDNNYSGEAAYVSSYVPNSQITNDALKEPLYAWGATTQYTTINNMEWETVAPSDGIYYGDYGSTGIDGWKNSLLVVTLKQGNVCERVVYRFKLNADGKSLAPSTVTDPNPAKFFGEDQLVNGRLRDIALSPDGSKIYLINNSGAPTDKITVYSYEKPTQIEQTAEELKFQVYPVPSSDYIHLDCNKKVATLSVCNVLGEEMKIIVTNSGLNISTLPHGTYYLTITTEEGNKLVQKIVRN